MDVETRKDEVGREYAIDAIGKDNARPGAHSTWVALVYWIPRP